MMTQHEVLREIIADCAELAVQMDGLPLNGETLGKLTGTMLAMIATLAEMFDKGYPQG